MGLFDKFKKNNTETEETVQQSTQESVTQETTEQPGTMQDPDPSPTMNEEHQEDNLTETQEKIEDIQATEVHENKEVVKESAHEMTEVVEKKERQDPDLVETNKEQIEYKKPSVLTSAENVGKGQCVHMPVTPTETKEEFMERSKLDQAAQEISAKPANIEGIDEKHMTLDEFEALFCSREIPSKWNVYKWCKEHGDRAISQVFFRVRRIMNRADFVQINISGGKDSTLSFEIASLELRYRKALVKAINEGRIIDGDKYQYVDIVYDESQNRNDYDVFEKTNEVYESFENINLNVPMIYLNSQDAELIFSDAINHIQYDVNLVHGYGLYMLYKVEAPNNEHKGFRSIPICRKDPVTGKVNDVPIWCGHDLLIKGLRDQYNVEIIADLWESLEGHTFIRDLSTTELHALASANCLDEKLIKVIEEGRFPYAAKEMLIGDVNSDHYELVCVIKGDQSGHMFYKCLSISYQDGSSYGSGRFVAWDKTKQDIWCREMPTRETHGLDILTNYNMCEANYLPVSKIKPELVELHKDDIKNIDGVDCIPNWGFGAKSLCEFDKAFEKMFGSLMLKKRDVYPELKDTEEGNKYAELFSYVSQSDEDAGGSETDTFARWILGSVPDFITTEFVPGKPRTHATQIYSLVSIRAAESFDRYTILKQSEYFTGQYASKEAR